MLHRGGAQIGRYRVLQLLGHGGMGDVYLATAHGAAGFEKPVVVKMLRPQGRHVIDLLKEAFIGVGLDHQNVVQVLDLVEHEGRYHIVMEYVRGFTLAHVLDDAQAAGIALPLPMLAHVVGNVADALDYVHSISHGLIHRDVSPSNILLGVDGRVKLSDFGVAMLTTEPGAPEALVGKPSYLPPEAFRGGHPTQAWDVYALGVVLWESIAGKKPFAGDSVRAIRTAVLAGPPPLDAVSRGYPQPLVDVATRAIHPDPKIRYRTAAELKHALVEASPPGPLDADLHRRYMRACYASQSFIKKFGEVPDTRMLLQGRELTPTPMPEADAPTMDASQPPIRIGLSQAGGSGWARGEGERLAARLAAVVGRPAVAVVLADYRSLIDALGSGALDLAWMPPAAFVEAEKKGGRALAVASRLGKTTYRSAIITRNDSAVTKISDLRGQSVAWVDRDSASGYLFALAELLRELGGTAELGRQHFVGSHRAVCEAVADGWAMAGATYAILDDDGRVDTSGWHERLGPRASEIRVVGYTNPIPGDNVACRPGLDPTTTKRLADALVALAGDDDGRAILHDVFRAEALVPEPGNIYDDVRKTLEILRAAGV
jgi:phosphate/phosphite/phosphonate ABC transporter binding protein